MPKLKDFVVPANEEGGEIPAMTGFLYMMARSALTNQGKEKEGIEGVDLSGGVRDSELAELEVNDRVAEAIIGHIQDFDRESALLLRAKLVAKREGRNGGIAG